MIRAATRTDIPAIVALGKLMWAESPRWSKLEFNGSKASAFLDDLFSLDDAGFAWLALRGDEVVGVLIAYVDEHWCSSDRIAQEIALFVRPDARGQFHAKALILEMKRWSATQNAKWLFAGTTTEVGAERTALLYESLGFRRCGIGLEV